MPLQVIGSGGGDGSSELDDGMKISEGCVRVFCMGIFFVLLHMCLATGTNFVQIPLRPFFRCSRSCQMKIVGQY